jgi:predicted ribosomally synthesized peptide with SipW-like signal peptide
MSDQNIELTRRKILGSVGAVGAAGAGAGLGTSALFSDEESFSNNVITAGTLDMIVDAKLVEANTEYENAVGPIDYVEEADGEVATGLQLSDFKPGDWVIVCYDISVQSNPGCVTITSENLTNYENGANEPERNDGSSTDTSFDNTASAIDNDPAIELPTGAGKGELGQNLVAEIYEGYDSSVTSDDPRAYLSKRDDTTPEGTTLDSADGTYSSGVTVGGGVALNQASFYLLLYLPTEVGNVVQSDSVKWDLTFDAIQARNNEDCGGGLEIPSESYIGYEDRPKGGDFDYNDFGMRASIMETYVDEELQTIDMEFSAEEYQAGDSHVISVKRDFLSTDTVQWEYELTRSGSDDLEGRADSDTGGTPQTGSGQLEIELFDTDELSGKTSTIDADVSVSVTITNGSEGQPTNSPRPDVAANDPLFEVYDVPMKPDGISETINLGTVQSGIDASNSNWDNEADVPNVIVVPDVAFVPTNEAVTISADYPEFDNYYAGGTSDDGVIEVDSAYDDWYS